VKARPHAAGPSRFLAVSQRRYSAT